MNWFDIAGKDDIAAHEFHGKLIDASLTYDWQSGWLKVPRRLMHHLYRASFSGEVAYWWSGFDYVQVADYEVKGRVYIRLALDGEFPE